jgi:hypothetical protein
MTEVLTIARIGLLHSCNGCRILRVVSADTMAVQL